MPIPIQNLIVQPELWRFAGFVSSVVGLLCYALSSPFRHLFGDWNFLKIILYITISSIICSMTLFAKKWQLSRSLLLKAHVGFLVFMLTSLYSFFYDKAINRKPDILSLISCGAFALTSLSLSRQIDLGFEVDLLNFFLGCLTLQLMKINWMLAFVGAVFCYLLIVLRYQLDSQLENGNVNVSQHVAIEIGAANGVERGGDNDRKKELYSILGIEKISEEKVIFPTNLEVKLREAMVAGFVKECCHVYSSWRRQLLNEKLQNMGLQKLDIKEAHKRPLNYLKDEIERWIKASKYVVKKLFPDERRLCNDVFFGFSPYADLCFIEVCLGSTIQLVNFANAIATGRGPPERLFRILQVFETLRHLLPDLESLFSDQCCVVIRDEAITICKKLGEEIRAMFMELENIIRQDPAKVAVPGGGIHPLNHYVMCFLCTACESWQIIEQVFEDKEPRLRDYPEFEDRVSLSTSLYVQVTRIIELLENNLESKSKLYKDSALRSVFMINNGRYIVQKATESELGKLLGKDWIHEHIRKVRKYIGQFERSSWSQLLGKLNLELDNNSRAPDVSAESLKEKHNLFISQFEEICEVQSTWVIFDDQLKEEIRSSLKENLLLAYENFIARFQNGVETWGHTDTHHGLEFQHVVTRINWLFQGRDDLKNRRNILPTWTVVSPTTKDFHEWRKYGQKTVPNSTYPRNYYSCNHKFNQGCQATKQVQQKQEIPQMFQSRYIGFHTCRMIQHTTFHY